MTHPTKKIIPLIDNTLMVDYQLQAIPESPTDIAIQTISTNHFSSKEFLGISNPSKKKRKILENILLNFAVMQSQGYELLVFPMGRRNFVKSRYLPEYYTPLLAVSVVRQLETLGFIKVHPSNNQLIRIPNSFGGSGTCVIPQAVRLELLADVQLPQQIDKNSIHRPKAEIIILKSQKTMNFYAEDKNDYSDRSILGKEVAALHRPILRQINSYLSRHEITYAGTTRCNRTSTSYHRVFNNSSLLYGGRYFGCYIQTLPKTERHLISIDGENISNVDYSGMHYNLMRWKDGAATEMQGDPFTISGYEQYRDEFKMLAYILLNAVTQIKHPPEGLKEKLLAKGWMDSFTSFKKILLANCPLIERHQGQGMGLQLMNAEAKIITKAMQYLMEVHECGFICMHDGLLVPSSKAMGTQAVMSRAFLEVVGYYPHIKITQH